MNLQNLNNVKEILDKELSDNLNLKSGTWEYHQLALIVGETKHLINNLNNESKLKRANYNYKLIKQGKL